MNIPVTILILAAASAVAFGQLTREQAVNALIDPGSGVPIDPAESQVWSPFVDFGSGAGFEGLLPQNSDVSPAQAGLPPFPGPGMPVNVDSYFFWIDDAPSARFQHETRFVLVHAGLATPTVGNGGIIVTAQGWWPVVTEAGGAVGAYFATAESRTTAAPVGFANPDGLVFGFATPPPPAPAPPPPGTPGGGTSTACGLIIRGSEGADFATDTQRFEKDLKEVHGLPDGRIVKANGGAAATAADIDAALTALCNISGCTKIYVRIVSHGSEGSLTLAGDTSISAADLCQKLQNIANKGVPICLLIDACHSSSLKDPNNWNFPAGSVIMTSSAASEISFGHVTPYTMPDGTSVSGGLYGASFSRCLRDRRADTDRDRQVEDNEAHNWVVSRQECWTWTGNGQMRYPGGRPDGTAGGKEANPEITEVARNPRYINYNIRNNTGSPKTDFHMVFKGDLDGLGLSAWRSNANDQIGERWAGGRRDHSYDPATKETTVTWGGSDADTVNAGDWVHVGVCDSKGRLCPVRQYWTPTTPTVDPQDRVPAQNSTYGILPGGGEVVVIRVPDVTEGGFPFPGGVTPSEVRIWYPPPPGPPLPDLNRPFLEGSGFPVQPVTPAAIDPVVPLVIQLQRPPASLPGQPFVLELVTPDGIFFDEVVPAGEFFEFPPPARLELSVAPTFLQLNVFYPEDVSFRSEIQLSPELEFWDLAPVLESFAFDGGESFLLPHPGPTAYLRSRNR